MTKKLIIVSAALVACSVIFFAITVGIGSQLYGLWKLPGAVRAEYQHGQLNLSEVSSSDRWVQISSKSEPVSFIDVTSLTRIIKQPNYVKVKFLYVFKTPIKVSNDSAKIAYLDGIFNCVSYKRVTVSTTYFGGVGDSFKQIIPGSPEEVELPIESIEYAEIKSACELSDVIIPKSAESHNLPFM